MSSNYLETSKQRFFFFFFFRGGGGGYGGVTLTILYLKVIHDMVSQNSYINFSDAAIRSYKYMP